MFFGGFGERSADDDVVRWLIVEKWRHDSSTEEDRSAGRPQALDEHHSWTAQKAHDLARRLELHYVYLGYWIAATPKMAYKKQYQPLERLVANRWQRLDV